MIQDAVDMARTTLLKCCTQYLTLGLLGEQVTDCPLCPCLVAKRFRARYTDILPRIIYHTLAFCSPHVLTSDSRISFLFAIILQSQFLCRSGQLRQKLSNTCRLIVLRRSKQNLKLVPYARRIPWHDQISTFTRYQIIDSLPLQLWLRQTPSTRVPQVLTSSRALPTPS